MDEKIAFLIVDIASFWCIIPSIIAIISWKKSSPQHRLLPILVWGGTFISIMAYSLIYFFNASNLYLLHIYTIFEFIVLVFIFRPVLSIRLANAILIIFPLFAAINSIFFEQMNTMNVLNRSISALLLMFFALSFFLFNLRTMKILKMEKEPLFWISIGVLFYNAASFFIFIFSKDLEPFDELWYTYFGIHSLFTILLYTFYSIALWVQLKQQRTYPSN